MRQRPDLERVEERMRPGELTLHGFLGMDDRALADVLEADERAVRALGRTHAQFAERLAELTDAGRDILEREREVEGRYKVKVRDDRGRLPCPFGDGLFAKGDTVLRDPRTGTRLRWNALTVHLVRIHGFYGGRGSDYRLEPATLAEVLDLGSAPEAAPGPGRSA